MTYQLAHTNRSEAETTLFPIITESLGTGVFAVVGLQPFSSSGAHLDDTMSFPHIMNYNQVTTTIDIWVHGD